jgi:malonate transporter and related proteins
VTAEVIAKLLAIFATIAVGWLAIRLRWFGEVAADVDPARILGHVSMMIFVPALLFRTISRMDLAQMPWSAVQAYFMPAAAWAVAVYLWQRRRPLSGLPAAPAARTVSAIYGNGVQLGVPMVAALFGELGLAIHIALVSLHGMILMTLLTVLAELDLARHDRTVTLAQAMVTTLRNSVFHPVVLPVMLGLAWNLGGLGLHPAVDQTLLGLGSAVVPVCLLMIGMMLGIYGVRGHVRQALLLSTLKLLVLPALVLVVAHWGFGLRGLALQVCVLMAALPSGTNALIFAQRYRTLEAEATATIVMSTAAFAVTATLWLAVLAGLP